MSSTKLGLTLQLIALWIGYLAGLTTYAVAQEKVSLRQTPRAVQEGTAQLIGHYDSAQKLRLVFALKPPHLDEEERFLNQLQDKDSPLFHKYLSEQEWNERFAPSAEDEQAVVGWAASQGLTITQRYPNRLLVDVEAPAGIIEKTLDVTMNRYQLGNDLYFSNDRDPSIPAALAGVVHTVLGLNNIQAMHSASRRMKELSHPDYAPGPAYTEGSHLRGDGDRSKLEGAIRGRKYSPGTQSSYVEFIPTDVYSSTAYDYQALQNLGHCCNPLNNPNNSPPEASIAIAIWDDFSDADFSGFISGNPYLAQNVQRHFVDGTPHCCGVEVTLDVEWATAMANSFNSSANTAEIHVYEGANAQNSTMLDVVNRALTDGHARVLSMSWGNAEVLTGPETMNAYHAVFDQMIGQGWTLVAAAGDGGATDDCADHLSVSYPASDPDVTAAGGTSLQQTPGYYTYEYAWSGGAGGCANNDGGGGGGCSAFWSAPPYQSNPVCGSRSVPDVALNADGDNRPQMFFYNGSAQPGGGTSIVAPEIAAFYAQENAYLLYIQNIVGDTCGYLLSSPCAPLGNANWYLYYEGLHAPFAPHYPFYDIFFGCNNNDITEKYGLNPFCAGPGYDLVTGWGSANMLQLAWTMNHFMAGDFGAPSVTISGPPINQWYKTDQTLSWSITDTSQNGHLPNGIAGSSQSWDIDPGDPYSETTPGSGSSYYGPQFSGAYGSAGGLATSGQGCHTAYVRAWDNAGQSQVYSYGPLCYDSLAPVTTIILSGNQEEPSGYYSGPVLVALSAIDRGSGVAATYYYLDQEDIFQPYSGPFYVYLPGSHEVITYSVDMVGNVEVYEYLAFVIDQNQHFTLSVSKAGTGGGTVTSSDGGIDCGSTCSSTYWDGQTVTLTATPAPGSVFTGWSGCDLSFGFSCTVLVTNTRNAVAIFNLPVALQFIPVPPCRLADTRLQDGGSGPIQGGTSQDFPIPQQGNCNIPATAAAYSLNVTVVPQGPLWFLTAWPAGQTRPATSTLNSYDGRVKANAAIVPAGANGAVSVYATNTTDVVLDINGYFVPATDGALTFYPLTPCRVVDTRPESGGEGPIQGGMFQNFPVQNVCGVPPSARSYSLNLTAVPSSGPVYVLTAWPAGVPQPWVSTLNDYTGTVVANAALVGAGTGPGGDVSVYVSDESNLVMDIDGYFAPPGPGGLSLYTVSPCRVLDTRNGGQPFTGLLAPPVDVEHGPCSPSAQAQAYVLNTTVLPQGALGFLTLWPDGQPQPSASTLNAWDGMVTNNMAIVPASDGKINAFAGGASTQLILDMSSYFAP